MRCFIHIMQETSYKDPKKWVFIIISLNRFIHNLDSNVNDSRKTKTLADQSNVENGKTRYLAFDGGGFGSVNREIVRCQNGLEVEVTDSHDRWNQVDFFYFHMAAPKIRPSANGYVMVYTMESEVNFFKVLLVFLLR